ncbi:universal stress protein [Massilia sp. CFBP9026]|uniref:universal stress protein n=1 Tax=Massilia sp. CFBP9026 TaxID=3096536 RepID=UPI002A6AFF86|nr:universal stress protein [Massilia sp. CFBP9026]MDY0965261.1 universal stress protein [Massilia sp. CFBP9026]
MPDPSPTTPPGLLLATDLSARCDRPLERAKQLADEFSIPLVVLTVHDAPQAPGDVLQWLDGDAGRAHQERAAREEFAREFAGSSLQVAQRFATGAAPAAILDSAATLPGAIVVAGASQHDSLGDLLLGSTVEKLARGLAQPLLVVRQRVRGPYRRIMVATDFTPASTLALETAARLFPGRRITVFHAHDADMRVADTLAPDAPPHAELIRFLDGCALPPGARELVDPVIGEGEPASQLARHVVDNSIDLVVLGLHEESALMRLLTGSRSEYLLQAVVCDTLLVRPPVRPGEDDENEKT